MPRGGLQDEHSGILWVTFFPSGFLRRNLLTRADDGYPHLWHAIFGNDFQDLEIRDAMGSAILEPVALRMPEFR